jgi:hypothetical protein
MGILRRLLMRICLDSCKIVLGIRIEGTVHICLKAWQVIMLECIIHDACYA